MRLSNSVALAASSVLALGSVAISGIVSSVGGHSRLFHDMVSKGTTFQIRLLTKSASGPH
jgi:hypothetical protein